MDGIGHMPLLLEKNAVQNQIKCKKREAALAISSINRAGYTNTIKYYLPYFLPEHSHKRLNPYLYYRQTNKFVIDDMERTASK